MAKRIRFPLEMDNGVEVRSMEELRENFSLARVLGYIEDGKMLTWLRDRYSNDIADALEQLEVNQLDFAKKVSQIFDVTYDGKMEEDLEKASERAERLKLLKQFTDEKKFIDAIDFVAFDQDELYDLLDNEAEIIYLCGERFTIPLSKQGVSYIGVNNPVAVIDSKVEVDWYEQEITLERVVYDDKYQAVVDSANATKEKLYEKVIETVKRSSTKTIKIGAYSDKTYLNFMIPLAERKEVEKMYGKAKAELEKLNYDVDADIQKKMELVHNNRLIGLAKGYLARL